ncbi:hypothetical protein OYC64_001984 [Pagothenia borchgrevinki]|uniref:Uncharacterized protein n=1 Tax=Pagothenia borchgrevinki TaxID=8213 RepID=A0ABD2GDU1_PAGBO
MALPCVSLRLPPPSCVRGPPCSLLSWSPLITHTCHHQAPRTAVHHAGWTSTLLHIVPSVAAPSGYPDLTLAITSCPCLKPHTPGSPYLPSVPPGLPPLPF